MQIHHLHPLNASYSVHFEVQFNRTSNNTKIIKKLVKFGSTRQTYIQFDSIQQTLKVR